MPRRIAINSKTSGKFRTEVLNNRPHLVTEMVSIVGDSVMNGLMYSLSNVVKAFPQIDDLHAPASHPTVNGQPITASSPFAVNAHNFGGIARKPRMEGKKVINELAIDIEVAGKDDRGIEIMRRIEAGEAIGVSTGLNAKVTNQKGKMGNTDFVGVVSDIKFDHVAILLDEAPAGGETFTVNSEDVILCNLADSVSELESKMSTAVDKKFSTDDHHVWHRDILFNPDMAIVRFKDKLMMIPFGYDDAGEIVFTGEGVEVISKQIYEPVGDAASFTNKEVDEMDKEKIVLAIISNAANSYTSADKDSLMSMSEIDLVNGVHLKIVAPAPTVDVAQEVIIAAGMTVNTKDFDADGYAKFVDNKPAFDKFLDNQKKERGDMVAKIVENSKMTKEQIEAMPLESIVSLANSFGHEADYSANQITLGNHDRKPSGDSSSGVDYSDPVMQ